MKYKLLKCATCGNIVIKIIDSGITPVCCGKPMFEIIPEAIESKTEYHIPVVERVFGNIYKVRVGKQPHPMTPQHYIQFIILETSQGIMIHQFSPGDIPEAIFHTDGKPIKAYAYCNLHGLW